MVAEWVSADDQHARLRGVPVKAEAFEAIDCLLNERLVANEREALADEREALADEREFEVDEGELAAGQREELQSEHPRERRERAEERTERQHQAGMRDQANVDREIAAGEREIARDEAEQARSEIDRREQAGPGDVRDAEGVGKRQRKNAGVSRALGEGLRADGRGAWDERGSRGTARPATRARWPRQSRRG